MSKTHIGSVITVEDDASKVSVFYENEEKHVHFDKSVAYAHCRRTKLIVMAMFRCLFKVGGALTISFIYFTGTSKEATLFLARDEGHIIVRMRGLPFTASEKDVVCTPLKYILFY